ncbi:hypothetical protein DEO72_LG10g1473 [Vigna unguiculata]|uniref:Uncharacterized protein n=1 Tax=Vigna unguiculata TaxID=3917 RepID=A0A4D6NDM7_VIGUN|nr:hypothetical protein DEO72_LG10g1473 [Vigna unguiculata]
MVHFAMVVVYVSSPLAAQRFEQVFLLLLIVATCGRERCRHRWCTRMMARWLWIQRCSYDGGCVKVSLVQVDGGATIEVEMREMEDDSMVAGEF